ncbi:hypothetical protein NFI96_027032, partial [Prochilodus magdalenae]
GTRDIGSALTRMCMRHRSIEAKLRQFSLVFVDSLINPLQEQMEEWKRVANTMDKDHAKEYKRARQEIKKKSSDTLKLQKKAKKGRGDLQPQVDSALQGVSDKYASLQETERQAVRKALIEERARFCTFVSMLRPAIEEEVCMLGEITHLQSISDDLRSLTMDPHKLPPSSEQVIADLKGSECSWSYQTPPSSPSTTSRKSSMCSSSLNSVNSSDSRSSSSHSHSPTSHFRYRGSALPQQGSARLPSVSSHDSGFTSQDTCQSKSPSPMPPDTNTQVSMNCHSIVELRQIQSQYSGPSHTSVYGTAGPVTLVFTCSGSSCPDESPQPITVSRTPTFPDTNTEDKLLNGYELLGPCAESSVESSLFMPPSPPPHSPPSHGPHRAWSPHGPALSQADFGPCFPLSSSIFPLSHRVPSWKDWARPGPYDQPMVNALRRIKERERVREGCESGNSRDEIQKNSPNSQHSKTRVSSPTPAPICLCKCLFVRQDEAHEELAVCLSRGLSLEIPRSRDSVQGSSGYNTQTNTPCCSEDTHSKQQACVLKLPRRQKNSQQNSCTQKEVWECGGVGKEDKVFDYDYFPVGGDQEAERPDSDGTSSAPRNTEISQSYHRRLPAKRPASTPGLPSPCGPTPGVATIRRAPSSKPSLWRGSSGQGPIPIRTPVIPVKTPTVPELPTTTDSESPQSPTSPSTGSSISASPSAAQETPTSMGHSDALPEEEEEEGEPDMQEDGMLLAVHRGVRLKKTMTNE